MRRPKSLFLLGIVLFIALGLRLWGINFGLPSLYHPDEPKNVAIAQKIFETRDINPHFFRYPSLFFYLHAVAYIPFYLAGKLLKVFASPADILGPRMITMGVGYAPQVQVFLIGRLLTTLFGVMSVGMLFICAWQLFDSRVVALLAAMMLAISPAAVQNSRYITPDVIAVFFTLLAFWRATKVFNEGALCHYVVAGLACGIAAATKYNAAVIISSVVAAHFLRSSNYGFKDKRLYFFAVICMLSFLFFTPYALFDYRKFFSDMIFEMRHYATGHAGLEGNTVRWYFSYLWRSEGIMAGLALLEMSRGGLMRLRKIVFVSVFPVLYFFVIARFTVRNGRTILLLMPFLFLLSASFVDYFLKQIELKIKLGRIALIGATFIVTLGLCVTPLEENIRNNVLAKGNFKEEARLWIDGNLPSGAKIALEAYSPYVDPEKFQVYGVVKMIDNNAEWYYNEGFEYLLFSKGMYGRFYRDPQRYSHEVSAYETLFNSFTFLKRFKGTGEIRIYSVSDD